MHEAELVVHMPGARVEVGDLQLDTVHPDHAERVVKHQAADGEVRAQGHGSQP